MVDGFVDGVVGNVVGGRLGAEKEMIADVLFDEAMAIVATDDGIGEIEVLEYGLQLSGILFRDLTTKDDGDLVGLPDGAVGIEKSLAQFIERSAAMKMRLSQYSTWAKKRRCWQPACLRSFSVKKGVKLFSHFRPLSSRSRAVSESASSCSRLGSRQRRNALLVC